MGPADYIFIVKNNLLYTFYIFYICYLFGPVGYYFVVWSAARCRAPIFAQNPLRCGCVYLDSTLQFGARRHMRHRPEPRAPILTRSPEGFWFGPGWFRGTWGRTGDAYAWGRTGDARSVPLHGDALGTLSHAAGDATFFVFFILKFKHVIGYNNRKPDSKFFQNKHWNTHMFQ